NFDAPISINPQGIAVKELVEIPEELTAGRNFFKDSQLIKLNPNDVGLGTSVYDTVNKYWKITAGTGKSISMYMDTFAMIGTVPIVGTMYTYSFEVMSPIAGTAQVSGGANFNLAPNEWRTISRS